MPKPLPITQAKPSILLLAIPPEFEFAKLYYIFLLRIALGFIWFHLYKNVLSWNLGGGILKSNLFLGLHLPRMASVLPEGFFAFGI